MVSEQELQLLRMNSDSKAVACLLSGIQDQLYVLAGWKEVYGPMDGRIEFLHLVRGTFRSELGQFVDELDVVAEDTQFAVCLMHAPLNVVEQARWFLIDRPNYGALIQAFSYRFFFGRWWSKPQQQFLMAMATSAYATLQEKVCGVPVRAEMGVRIK